MDLRQNASDSAAFGAEPGARRPGVVGPHLWIWPAIAWLLVIVTSPVLMMPNTDDAFYFLPALGLMAEGTLAVPVNGGLERLFFNFPTFSIFQGLFLIAADAIGVPVHYYLHRIFNGIVVAALLGLSLHYIDRLARPEAGSSGQIKLVFLALLGVTPFAQTWVLVRPEPFGLLFLVASLVAYHHWTAGGRTRRPLFYASAFLLGVPLTAHPVFVPVCGMVLLAMSILERRNRTRYGSLALFIVAAGVPLIALAMFYLLNSPESVDQLRGQTEGGALLLLGAIRGLFGRALPFVGQDAVIRQFVSAAFFFPLMFPVFGSVAAVILAPRLLRRNADSYLPLLFLFLSVPIVLALFFNFIYIFGLAGFVSALFVAVALGPQIVTIVRRIFRVRRPWIFAFASIVAVGLWAEMHVAKYSIFPDRFLRPDRVLAVVESERGQSVRLFVTRPELVPLFLKEISATNDLGDAAPLPTYWLFPASGKFLDTEAEIADMRAFLENKFADALGRDLWFMNKRHFDAANMTACLRIARTPFSIGLKASELVYQDHRYILLRAAPDSLDCQQG